MPVAAFVVARAAMQHRGGYQPPPQTSPHCHAGSIVERQSSGAFAPHIAEAFGPHFYLRHTPTLANFKHLDDRCERAYKCTPRNARHRELIPGLARASLFSHRHRTSGNVGTRSYPRLDMSTHSPPGEPQFPVAH